MRARAHAVVVGVLGLLLLGGILLHLLGGDAARGPGSVFSGEPTGRSVAFELLHELGFPTRAWTGSPGDLPAGPGLLVARRPPPEPEHYELALPEGGEGPRAPAGKLDPAHYGRFVRAGGTLLLHVEEDVAPFLDDAFGWSLPEPRDEERAEAGAGGRYRLDGGSVLASDWTSVRALRPLEGFRPLLVDDAQARVLASARPAGEGRLVLLADDSLLANASLEEAGCALLVVRLAEDLAGGGPVWFDEYVLGGWAPESAVDLAFGPAAFPLTAQILLFLAVGLWSIAWVRAFPRDPPQRGPVSARMRARGWAGLLVAAGRWELLARMLRRGVLRRLGARSGLVPVGEPDEAWVRAALAPILGAPGAPGAPGTGDSAGGPSLDEAVAWLTTEPVNGRQGLEELDRRLASLEERTHRSRGRRDPAPTP